MNASPYINFYAIDALVEHLAAGHTIITPNDRLARRIKQAWAQLQQEQGSSSWTSPAVFSLQQWWRHCYDSACLDGHCLPALVTLQQELEIWQQVIEADPESTALLRPRGAAKLAREAWHSLLLWQQDWRQAALGQEFRFDPDASIFLRWAAEFETALLNSGLAALPALLPDLVQQQQLETLVLAEFDELAPLYEHCLSQQAGHIERVYAGAQSAQCRLLACEDSGNELDCAAQWAAQQFKQDPATRIGILLPSLQQQRFTMERALRKAFGLPAQQPAGVDSATRLLPVNFSAGVTLASCGPVRAALGLLGLLQRQQALPEFASLLHSRYRDLSEIEQEQQLLRRLYRLGRETVSASRLRRECERITSDAGAGLALGTVLVRLNQDQAMKRKRSCSQWAPWFQAILEALGWPGDGALDSLEYQQVEQWHKVLEQLREFDAVTPQLDFDSALQRLQSLCENAVFQPQTPDARIQVLGLLEAAGLEFDALWLCGFGANNWPPAPEPNPFIPGRLQKQLGMPHASAERELRYARGLLQQFQRSTRSLIASYSQQEDDVEQRASALLMDYQPWELASLPPVLPVEWTDIQSQAVRSNTVDAQAPALTPAQAAELGGGSTLIADQSQCPFRAFARHRLGAQPLPELASGLNAAERGTLLHESLFHLWDKLGDSQTLLSQTAAQREALIAESVDLAITAFRINDAEALGRSLLEVERQRLQQLLLQWLAVESQREAFEVTAREEQVELQLGPLQLSLRIDRIDRLANGRQLIIDYKSGSAGKAADWMGDRPEAPQLPLYALLAGDELAGLGFGVINAREVELRGLGEEGAGSSINTDIARASKGEIEDWQSLRVHWETVLRRLADDFVAGRAAVDPVDRRRSCNYCGLESLCRVQ
ncbi:MAG: PD-(D/E)XK nuclease family protein [Halieaceae bacterium]